MRKSCTFVVERPCKIAFRLKANIENTWRRARHKELREAAAKAMEEARKRRGEGQNQRRWQQQQVLRKFRRIEQRAFRLACPLCEDGFGHTVFFDRLHQTHDHRTRFLESFSRVSDMRDAVGTTGLRLSKHRRLRYAFTATRSVRGFHDSDRRGREIFSTRWI